MQHQSKSPLFRVLSEIAGMWLLANLGYYLLFPALGFGLDYNTAPILITLYFLACALIAASYFRSRFISSLILDEKTIWVESIISIGFACTISLALYLFSFLPVLHGPVLAPYTDILFAAPPYFLAKMAEILVQQILVAVLALELAARIQTLRGVILGFAVTFGGVHVLQYVLDPAPTLYASIMTSAALLSSLIFPYLILRVRGGFIYSYGIHVLYYIGLASILHSWPPPGYGI